MPLKGGHENVAVVPASVALIQDHPSKIVGQWSVKKKWDIYWIFVRKKCPTYFGLRLTFSRLH